MKKLTPFLSLFFGLFVGPALAQTPVITDCQVTTGAPTYTTGTTRPCSLDTSGNVRTSSSVAAGETHIGEVGGNQIIVTVAQTVTASSAYATGNAVGGLITFAGASRVSGSLGASGTGGLVQSVAVNSKSAQTTQMDAIFFKANPSGSTCTDKTALAVAAADFDKIIGVAHVTDWTNLGTPSTGQSQNLAMPYDLSSATSFYACLVTRSTPTFAATTDISISIELLRN